MEPMCPICEKEPETVVHALWACLAASDVWGSSKRVSQKCEQEGRNFMQIAELIFWRGGMEVLTIFVNLARRVWLRRNKWIHEGVFTSPSVILLKSDEFIEEYNKAHERSKPREIVDLVDRGKAWTAPNPGWLKANCMDVAINKTHDRVGISVVIRGEKGQVIAATTGEALGVSCSSPHHGIGTAKPHSR